ncbi:hypothetical protein FHG87_016003 [Trinorchestia longiramus]|nr:hypothetical protein FHG87_016003 [Trinorchestia longiramus]
MAEQRVVSAATEKGRPGGGKEVGVPVQQPVPVEQPVPVQQPVPVEQPVPVQQPVPVELPGAGGCHHQSPLSFRVTATPRMSLYFSQTPLCLETRAFTMAVMEFAMPVVVEVTGRTVALLNFNNLEHISF